MERTVRDRYGAAKARNSLVWRICANMCPNMCLSKFSRMCLSKFSCEVNHFRHRRRKLGQVTIVLQILLQCGCSETVWPEGVDELRSNYFDKQKLFFELAGLLAQSDQNEVFVSKNSDGVRISVEDDRGKSIRLWVDPAAVRMNYILEHLELASARIIDGQLRYEVLQRGSADGRRQTHYVAYSKANIPIIDRCRDLENDPPTAGACFVALDQSWRVEFNW